MKFTFPVFTLSKGGAQRMLAEITNGLVDRGHDVTILMASQGKVDYPTKARLVRTKNNIIGESDFPKSDVIISNFYTMVPYTHAASQDGKGMHVRLSLCYEPPFIENNHESFPSYYLTPNLIVLSKSQQQIIFLEHGIKGHIVPVGISTIFKNFKIRNAKTPIQISAIVRKPEGGLSWHREQDYLISQLKMVHSRYPNTIINLISPPDEFYSSPILKKLKNTNNFKWFTPADDKELCYHYNHTDIFVNSSIYDSASIPGLEAMRCGAAFVTTYNGGNLEYCRHEENALISYRYQNQLGNDIIRLIEDPSLRSRIALAGEKEAEKWTWERSVASFEEAIQKMIITNQ
ncbi:glycosyltransferase involved in cell wall biosynthesis [Metabacillus crassostreae]|uniref:glycosyltransferase family 4 protein n=1 Tax=Metabacillus crassostreae TaxID=929098 RepID=UPI0019590632|nr:glycosyltransferase family 4 protein [Metabacillus crassostreae]MBM7603170.1 glycosyltransferase involved in cell wall biosynthesis [Metabacillus crassostreae]